MCVPAGGVLVALEGVQHLLPPRAQRVDQVPPPVLLIRASATGSANTNVLEGARGCSTLRTAHRLAMFAC